MIKILMCGNHPSNKGGMTSVISQLLRYDWGKKEIKMKFIPTFYPANNIIKAWYFVVAYMKILFVLLLWRPDILHMHMSYKGSFHRKYLVHKLCKKFGVKDIIHLHGGEFEKWYMESDTKIQQKIRQLMKECDLFLVLGERWKKVVEEIEPSVNAEILYNAVSIPKASVNWSEKKFQVVYLGVLIPKKGLDILLQAIRILKDTNRLGKMCFAIAGSGTEEERLKNVCKEEGLEDVVTFYGWIDGVEKEKLFLDSQASVQPSYNEGLPISVLEAISYGMPIVATDVGDMAAAVEERKNGYLVNPGDAEQLADRLAELYDKERFESMSKVSRKIAEQRFSETEFLEKVEKSYLKLKGKEVD